MCGIAGIIHRGKSNNVGGEMQKMLQSLKHRGPDSTGYALYGEGESNNYILRFKVGENVKEGTTAVKEDPLIKILNCWPKTLHKSEQNFRRQILY